MDKQPEAKTVEKKDVKTADIKPTEPQTIPKERLDAVLNDKKQLETQLNLMQNQMEILKANMTNNQPKAETPKNIFDGMFGEGETIVERKHLEGAAQKIVDAVKFEIGQMTSQIGLLSARIDNPDGEQVLNDHFLNVVKAKPKLFDATRRLAGLDPALANIFAVEIAKTDPAYLEKQSKKNSAQSDIEQQIADLKAQLENKTRPLGMGGGGGGTGMGGSKLSQTLHEIANLTTEEFLKRNENLKSGAEKLPTS